MKNATTNKKTKELTIEPYPETIPETQSLTKTGQIPTFQKTIDPIEITHLKRSKLPGNIETVKISERMAQKMGIEVFAAPELPRIPDT